MAEVHEKLMTHESVHSSSLLKITEPGTVELQPRGAFVSPLESDLVHQENLKKIMETYVTYKVT